MTRKWVYVLLVALVGCANHITTPSIPADPVIQASWPAAPERARIRYLYSFKSYKDLDLRLPFSSRFEDMIAGSQQRVLVRPYSIAVDNKLIAIADPGIGLVHLFDTHRGMYRRISQVDNMQLNSPIGVSLADDRVFIADSALNEVYILDRKLNYIFTIQNLDRPSSLAWDSKSGRLFVAETLSHRLKVFDRDGNYLSTTGKRGTGFIEFNFPTHIAIKNGLVFINDTMNFRVQILDGDGKHINTFGEHGDAPGYFTQPKGIAIDSQDHVYVSEALSNRIQLFETDGNFLMDFGGEGNSPGRFSMPAGLAFHDDRLYVCDSRNGRIQVFEYLRED